MGNQNLRSQQMSAKDRNLGADKLNKQQQPEKPSLGGNMGDIRGTKQEGGNKDIDNMDWGTVLEKNKEMAERRPEQIREAGQEAYQEGLHESVDAYKKGRQAHKQNKGKKAAVAPQAFDAIPEHDKASVDITSKNAQFTYDPKSKKGGRGKTSRENIQDKAQELSSAMDTVPGGSSSMPLHKRDHEAFIQDKAGDALGQAHEEEFTGQEKKKADIKKNRQAFQQVVQDIPSAGHNLHETGGLPQQEQHGGQGLSNLQGGLQGQGMQGQQGGLQQGGLSNLQGGLQQGGLQQGGLQQSNFERGQGQFTDGTENFHGKKGDAEFENKMETVDDQPHQSEMQGIGTGFGSMQQAGQQQGGGEQINVKDTVFNTGMDSQQQGGMGDINPRI